MIRTQAEYDRALKRLERDREHLDELKKSLKGADLSDEEVERAMQPAISIHKQLLEEVEAYERMRRGQFEELQSLTNIGRWLIGLRIYRNWSQKELSQRLEVSEAQVSKDERNEYHNVTTQRAQKILEVLGADFSMEIDDFKPVLKVRGERELDAVTVAVVCRAATNCTIAPAVMREWR